MTQPRETIIAALLARLKTLTEFRTISREWRGMDAADALDKLNALFLIELSEKYAVQGRGMPARIDLPFDIVLVIKNEPGTQGCSALNTLLDAFDHAFQPNPAERAIGGRVTLGGIAYDVWIEGAIQKNPSYLGGRASLAVIPLHLRITN